MMQLRLSIMMHDEFERVENDSHLKVSPYPSEQNMEVHILLL